MLQRRHTHDTAALDVESADTVRMQIPKIMVVCSQGKEQGISSNPPTL
jgi:hypothetical protein